MRSLLVPYVCLSCYAETIQLLELTPGTPLALPAAIRCPKCQTQMQLDEPAEMYESLHEKLSAR